MTNLFPFTANRAIVPSGSMLDFHILQTFFVANLTKAVIFFDYAMELARRDNRDQELNKELEEEEQHISSQLTSKNMKNILRFYGKHNLAARLDQLMRGDGQEFEEMDVSMGEEEEEDDVSSGGGGGGSDAAQHNVKKVAMLLSYVKRQMCSFLRCSCLFYRCMTDKDFPDTFPKYKPDKFDLMCEYLGLNPQLDVYFDMESAYATMMQSFASHPYIRNDHFIKQTRDLLLLAPSSSTTSPQSPTIRFVPCLRPLPHLVKLYDDYSDLINSVSDIFCPNNEREEMKTPTMCLICGTILCGQSYCCQPELGKQAVGACTHHAHNCGAEVGIFLRIRDCQVVYLGRGKGCFVQPPYLDEYGETDQGLRRGNPLRLCKAAYDRIFLQWLGHNLHEEIARLNENANVAVTQWHHM